MSPISAAIVGVSFSLTCFVALGFVSVAWGRLHSRHGVHL